ncbi:Cysteine proteinase 15A [Glycine soja]|uniref:Cysteine proteinase 15A n=1 Tax=Glycine soja TaxID=3848 RepID=A0A0B2QV27_GLYSO|nr:Cysteine proteinase 15A [Glycine soja]
MARYSFLLALLLLLFAVVTSTTDDILIRQVVPDAVSEATEKEDEDHLLNEEHHFTSFKAKFGKKYVTKEEHNRRFGVFKSNLHRARLHAKLDPSVVHNITKLSDLTSTEFRIAPTKTPNELGEVQQGPGVSSSGDGPLLVLQGAPNKVIMPPTNQAFIKKYCALRQAQGETPQQSGDGRQRATDAPPPPLEFTSIYKGWSVAYDLWPTNRRPCPKPKVSSVLGP